MFLATSNDFGEGGGGSKACDMECCTFFKVALQRIEDQTDNSIH